MTAPPMPAAAETAAVHDGRAAPDELLTFHEAAAEGYGAYSSLHKARVAGRLPARRVGREWRVRRGDLLALQPQLGFDGLYRMIQTLNVAPLTDAQIEHLISSFAAALRNSGGAA